MTSPTAAPVRRRRRKTVLTPPIIDPPLRGTGGVWPDIIATVRPLPASAFDDRPVLGVWFNDRAVVRVPEMAAWFNELAARAGLHVGMVCGTDYFDIWETERGACDYAELTDRGPVGQFLRVLKRYGGFSPKASLGEHALSVRWMIEENNEAVAEANDRVLRLAPPERRPVSEIARCCEHVLDFLIEPLIAHRDIPVGAPKFIHGPLRRRKAQ